MGDGLLRCMACALFYGQPFAFSVRITSCDCFGLGGFDYIRILEEYTDADFTD